VDDPYAVCELCRLEDLDRLSEVEWLLESRGIEADIWPETGKRAVPWAARSSRLMVRCRDLVYARWVAAAAGLDTWPPAPDGQAG
jgi:hypothetical protein